MLAPISSRPPVFAHRGAALAALLVGLLVLSGCPDSEEDPGVEVDEICDDGLDNDGNGATDCDDVACMGQPECAGEICDDGADNDGDGDVDCDDADCAADDACAVEDEVCDDGVDNDEDGETDCSDDDCVGEPVCDEVCGDGADNDADGDIDCVDSDCDGHESCVETECDDGIDNDKDDAADCEDDDCFEDPACIPVEDCTDGMDNDRDGMTDCADADCADDEACQEVCDDGTDNDADGDTDCADEDCTDDEACQEVCDDGADNDADGDVDCADADCTDSELCQEDCTDGVDNDADGRTDCADDSCAEDPECNEVCDDRIDNDADGDTDCADDDCAQEDICQENCTDGIDNDADGDVDCADNSCDDDEACQEICDDGLDNDADGDVDCADADCADAEVCQEICDDGLDNDADGDVDCADDSCSDDPLCQEDCGDGVDNDADGDVDCADNSCVDSPLCIENCTDGIDNDADGDVDCADASCADDDSCQEVCDDGQDNDADGDVDCADEDCAENNVCIEVCNDGEDNDADGDVDCADEDCDGNILCVEVCTDGQDNDADGDVDCADEDCQDDDACQEVCDDGADNDADGDVDCADADCDGDDACIEICDDGQDNDADGDVDCADEDCAGNDACIEICDDGADNDADGDVDCADEDCAGDDACIEICDDGADNDADGDVDCADEDCAGDDACIEICDDGADNDADGDVDCADEDCAGDDACIEICDDGADNDADGITDCSDPDCAGDDACIEICTDGVDNDADGRTDCADLDCVEDEDCQEICDDGTDNDADGRTDCADPDCVEDELCQEICDDGEDNDADGRVDCGDPDCAEFQGCNDPVEICDNGIDDDNNEAVDCQDIACAEDPACQEVCDNGEDDDNDNDVDCADEDCAGHPACEIQGGICEEPFVINRLGTFTGTTVGREDLHQGSCQESDDAEAVYAVGFQAETPVCIDTNGSSFDTVLYVRENVCEDGEEIGCNDDINFPENPQSQVEFQAVPGTTYFIFVDSFTGNQGTYNLNIRLTPCAQEPAEEICDNGADEDFDGNVDCADDDCADFPACVPGLCTNPLIVNRIGAFEGNNFDATDNGAGQCGGDGGSDVVYAVQTNGDGVLCIDTIGSEYDTVLHVRAGDCEEGGEVACNDDIDQGNTQSQVELQTQDGVPYFIYVDAFDADALGGYVLNVAVGACDEQPAVEICDNGEDDDEDGQVDCVDPDCAEHPACQGPGATCDEPLVIEQLGQSNGDTSGQEDLHTPSCRELDGPEDVWVFGVGEETTVCIDTFGTGFDTVLYVRAEDCEGDDTVCNDDANDGTQSQVEFTAVPEVPYFVFVDGFNGAAGEYNLNVRFTPCDQEPVAEVCDNQEDDDFDGQFDCADPDCVDDPVCVPGICTNPLPINLGQQEGNNDEAQSNHTGQCGGLGAEVIYAFAVPEPLVLCIDTVGTPFDTVLHVREGDCVNGGEVVCNDDLDLDTLQSQVEFQAEPDTNYFVFVDTFSDNHRGDYVLNVAFGPCGGQQVLEICDNGEDDDNDGEIDCVDPDCEGAPNCQEPQAPVNEGDVIFTEVMYDTQTPLSESSAEWFELFNTTDSFLTLDGCILSDQSQITATVEGVILPPGGFALFARSDNPEINGGIVPDGTFTFSLNNAGDALTVTCDGEHMDTVAYDDGPDFPNASQVSMQLDPGSFNHVANGTGSNWCLSEQIYFEGEPGQEHAGTPGEFNLPCQQEVGPFTEEELQFVFMTGCSGGFCHIDGQQNGGLNLDDFTATAIGQPSSAGLNYIEPGNPDASYILHKLLGTQGEVGGDGNQMPLGQDPWSQENIDRFIGYIEAL